MVEYELTLEGGTKYRLWIDKRLKIDSNEEAQKLVNTIHVEKGYKISLENEKYDNHQYVQQVHLGEYLFTPQIFDNQNEKISGTIKLRGPKRKSAINEGESKPKMTILSLYREPYRCNFDEGCFKPPAIIFNNFGKGIYFAYKTKIDLEKNLDQPLIYEGIIEEKGKRYYRFRLKKSIVDCYYESVNPYYYCWDFNHAV